MLRVFQKLQEPKLNQKVAAGILEQRGHEITIVGDGQLAVDAVKKEQFDLVLMDIQMPVLDGIAATAAIRDSDRDTKTHLPIIAMTANAMQA